MAELTPLYVGEPERLKGLHDNLIAAHAELPDIDAFDTDGPLVHAANLGRDWEVTLKTSTAGQLLVASAVRGGVERYDFEQTGIGDWSARDLTSRFADTHFFNLVNMVNREDLDWTVAPG